MHASFIVKHPYLNCPTVKKPHLHRLGASKHSEAPSMTRMHLQLLFDFFWANEQFALGVCVVCAVTFLFVDSIYELCDVLLLATS